MSRTRFGLVKGSLFYLMILVILVYSFFPVYWMLVSSFKTIPELFGSPPTLYPKKPTLTNYINLITKTNANYWLMNSSIVTIIAVFICITISCFAAYSLTRFRFRGRAIIGNSILFVYMFPPIMVGIPLFFLMNKLNLLDSRIGLIIAYSSKTLPYTIWLLRAFFQTIPIELEESAFIDGATRVQTLARIVFPLAIPGIIATSVFSLVVIWNEYVYALMFISSELMKTIPVGLRSFTTSHGNLWQYIFPLSVMASLPLLIFFLYVQKRLLETMAGGVKG